MVVDAKYSTDESSVVKVCLSVKFRGSVKLQTNQKYKTVEIQRQPAAGQTHHNYWYEDETE